MDLIHLEVGVGPTGRSVCCDLLPQERETRPQGLCPRPPPPRPPLPPISVLPHSVSQYRSLPSHLLRHLLLAETGLTQLRLLLLSQFMGGKSEAPNSEEPCPSSQSYEGAGLVIKPG